MNHLRCAAIVALSICPIASGELIVYQNTNPGLDTLKMFNTDPSSPSLGQALDLTHSAFDQPVLGDLPGGSVFFLETSGLGGDFIWMGMGRLTMTAQSTKETLIPDPFAGQLVPYYGPTQLEPGDQINDSTNFVDGFRAIHGVNKLTDEQGIFTVDESFTIGVRFELDDGDHFGFAQFKRTIGLTDDGLEIKWHPIEWGYESIAGVGINIVPTPGMVSMGLMIGLTLGPRARRR